MWGAVVSCETLPEESSRAHWADVTLTETGISPIQTWNPAERMRGIQMAKKDGAQKLQEKVLLLKTESGRPFSEKVQKDKSMEKLAAYIREAEVVEIRNKPTGIEVTTSLSLGDPFKAAMGLLKRKEIGPPNGAREDSFR
ncbi:MAG: hypothetical protein AAB300_00400 [Nitrospirota bacterium]